MVCNNRLDFGAAPDHLIRFWIVFNGTFTTVDTEFCRISCLGEGLLFPRPHNRIRNAWHCYCYCYYYCFYFYYFWPTSTKPVGTKTLRKWNNGLQRASCRWTCFEMRPHSSSVVPRTAAGTGSWTPWHRLQCWPSVFQSLLPVRPPDGAMVLHVSCLNGHRNEHMNTLLLLLLHGPLSANSVLLWRLHSHRPT